MFIRRTTAFIALGLGLLAVSPPAAEAHKLEPISTEFAAPFAPWTGSLQIVYEFESGKEPGASEQAIPEAELELGVLPRFQINVGYPLLRVDEGVLEPARVTGGHVEMGARYLLLGGSTRGYAVSLQGEVAAPAGSRAVVGNATEVGAALHLDRDLGRCLRLHSNLGWSTSIGGQEPPERVFRYANAVVWMASRRWNPVLEVLGETETRTGETRLAVQPEMILWANPHLELKVGVPVGLTSNTPDIGVRAQVAIIWVAE